MSGNKNFNLMSQIQNCAFGVTALKRAKWESKDGGGGYMHGDYFTFRIGSTH